MPGRQFKYQVDQVPIEVIWDPSEKSTFQDHKLEEEVTMIDEYHKVIKTWRIHVWNSVLLKDQQKQLRLFPYWQKSKTITKGIGRKRKVTTRK
jgi:hypothetical protein